MTSTMDFPSGLRQAFDPLLRSSSKCVGKLNISRVSEKRFTQMKNAGIWTACDDVDNGLDNTCEVIRQETVLFSTPETDYIIYD